MNTPRSGTPPGLHVYTVQTPSGRVNVLTYYPPAQAFRSGLPRRAIIGTLPDPPEIGPEHFTPNPGFRDFLFSVIGQHAPRAKELHEEARRLGNGWVYLIDARAENPQGEVEAEDIIGAFEAGTASCAKGRFAETLSIFW